MRHPDYPFWSFIALVLVILPAPWHWRARNIATLSIIFWLTLANITLFTNTIVWADNYRDSAPVWCDISSRITLLVNYAIPACSLSQMRRLESVASTRRSVVSARERKRRMWEELILCNAFPVLLAALCYIVQGHRYDIIENVGCNVPGYTSVPNLILRYIVPMTVSVASLVYAVLAIRWFLIRRLQFRSILASSESSLSVSRYLRLIALAATDSTVLLSIIIFDLAYLTSSGVFTFQKYRSWEYVHQNFSEAAQWPEELSPSSFYYSQVPTVYAQSIYSILFFIFFGFGEEAVAEYITFAMRLIAWGKNILVGSGQQRTATLPDRSVQLGSRVVPAASTLSDIDTYVQQVAASTSAANSMRLKDDLGRGSSPQDKIAIRVERSIV